MSILKESLKTALISKPMALLVIMILIFLGAVGYFVGYLTTYQETVVSTTPLEIHVMKVKKQNIDNKYNVYFRYGDKEVTYVSKLSACVIKPKIEGTTIKGEQIHYSYTTMFNNGQDTRLLKPNELFCVQK